MHKLVEPYQQGANSIIELKIIEINDDNFALRIDSDHLKKDEQWMNKKAKSLLLLNQYNTLCSLYFYSYSDSGLTDELRSKFEALDTSKESSRKEFDHLIEETILAARESKLVVLSYCSINF